MAYQVHFSRPARKHLKALRKRDQQIIVDAIAASLVDEPDRPARHRKKLEENELAPWELRVGNFRVFYDVDTDNETVAILAVGKKEHNTLRIEHEEVEL